MTDYKSGDVGQPPPSLEKHNEKRASVPRVSFAPEPSYFSDPPEPQSGSGSNQRRSSSSHKRKSYQDHDKQERENERRNSSRNPSSDQDIGSGDSKQARRSSKRSSRRSGGRSRERDASTPRRSSRRRSSSQRRSHSATRRRNSDSKRSSHHGRDEFSDHPREISVLENVDPHDSPSMSSKEDMGEEQFDDEYHNDLEERGQRRRKNRPNSSDRNSTRDQDRSSSRKRSKSPKHHNKRHSSLRRSASEIEKEHAKRSHLLVVDVPQPSASQNISYDDIKALKLVDKEKRRQREKKRLRNRAMMCFCVLLCFLSTLGLLVGVLLRGGAVELDIFNFSDDEKPTMIAPTEQKCRDIAKGALPTSESSSALKQFQIAMEVGFDDQKEESNAPFLPLLETTLQKVVMPILIGCEPAVKSRRRMKERLPQYVISNGLIVDAQFDNLKIVTSRSSEQPSKYSIKVLVDLWLLEEVDNGLLQTKVWKIFDEFMNMPGIPADFPVAASTVLRVDSVVVEKDESPREGTAFPTLQPTIKPSYSPSLVESTFPTLNPSSKPSSNPSGRPTHLPSSEPSMKPSAKPSILTLTPTQGPTPKPTMNPTRSPTIAPTTSSPTRAPVDINRAIDVVVIGAGAAGLSAAYHLQREGVSVLVLEASSQIGGRIKKDDSTWDLGIDLGAEWLSYKAGKFDSSNDMLTAILDRSVNYQTIREPNLAHEWSGSTMVYNPPGATSSDYRWVDFTWWDFLNREFVSNLPQNTILLDSAVKTIDYGYEKPIVTCTDGRAYQGSYVIVTASTKVLQDGLISFVPSLPSDYQDAIDDIEMGSGIKVFLEFTEKFFPDIFSLDPDKEDYNFKDCESSSHGLRYFYSPTYGQSSSKHIMGMFAYADIADLYIGKPENIIIQSVLDLLDQIFNGKASATFVKGVVQDWSSEPYVRAAYTQVAPKDAVETLRDPIDNKVFFAGESVFSKDSDWGFVHGAALRGEDVAEDIADAINGQR